MRIPAGRKALFIASILLAVVACAGLVYSRYFYGVANPSEKEFPARGIDISAHNGEIDYSRLKEQGVSFAYVKATEGTDFRDRRYIRNVNGLNRQGIAVGAYHFFRFDTDGEMQGWNFINAMQGRKLTLRPAVDVEEWANAEGESTGKIMQRLRTMLTLLRNQGYDPIVYTNKDGYHRFMKGKLDDYDLWLCSFTDPPLDVARDIHLWQYTHRGSLDGISGAVDMNATRTLGPLMASAE